MNEPAEQIHWTSMGLQLSGKESVAQLVWMEIRDGMEMGWERGAYSARGEFVYALGSGTQDGGQSEGERELHGGD